ncbi:hypothetical protein Dsin_021626 [Dipteronia sinensis]|uniref:protein-serine/threonine phosphatase n=1 Tax=Dipteronia sinensis TaxID=43782 RepID=A0AAE0A1C2_9ROSI|nr:hypothetical protein Dsin_021626 [Dipteronia sinensis]
MKKMKMTNQGMRKPRMTMNSKERDKSLKMDICTHPGSFEGMCALYGKMLEEEPGVKLGYIHKGLRFTNDEIVRLGNIDTDNLLHHRKLISVLDLDHTLLNSTLLAHLTPE